MTSKVSCDQDLIWGFLDVKEEQLQEQWFEQLNMQEDTKETNSISSEDPYINQSSVKKKII